MIRFFAALLSLAMYSAAFSAPEPASKTYDRALNLIHESGGRGPKLEEAMKLAESLMKAAPKSGYAQVLAAEMLSTYRLGQDGDPPEVKEQVVALADQALKLNPKFAQAHVAKARAFLRSGMYAEANNSTLFALDADPNLSGAMFMRADYHRIVGPVAQAEIWYRKFIDSVPGEQRKANGYYWMAKAYDKASYRNDEERKEYAEKAKAAYERAFRIIPMDVYTTVNYAIFLNDNPADFDGAEKYARKALDMMEFPMARYHLAAAQYQRLAAQPPLPTGELFAATMKVAESTGVSLEDALAFECFSGMMMARLASLYDRVSRDVPAGTMIVSNPSPKRVSCG